MSLRRTRFSLLVVAALAAMALSATAEFAGGGSSQTDGNGEASFAARAPRAEGLTTRLTGDERRDLSKAERPLKHRLVFVAMLATLSCVACSAWRSAVLHGGHRRPAISLWSPHAGRSPPTSSFSIV